MPSQEDYLDNLLKDMADKVYQIIDGKMTILEK